MTESNMSQTSSWSVSLIDTLCAGQSRLLSLVSMLALILATTLSGTASAGTEDEIVSKIRKETGRLVSELRDQRQTFYDDKSKFYEIMEGAMEDSVDFKRIAARIMGRYRREASDDQQARFVATFKHSLFNAYGKTLVEAENFKINVLDAEVNPRADDRASVDLEVVSETGNKYPVLYSVYKSEKRGWLMENVIVNGVNIGLAFRDKFEQLMSKYKGNIDDVIANWTSTVEEERLEKKS